MMNKNYEKNGKHFEQKKELKNETRPEENEKGIVEESNKELGIHRIKETFRKSVDISKTKFYKGSLRSGQRLEFEGSLVIIGDVNSGSEVIAEDNIVVLGTLRGLAHSGARGNKDAFISAGKIMTPQIRIANKIFEFERKSLTENNIKTFAFLNQDEKIIVE